MHKGRELHRHEVHEVLGLGAPIMDYILQVPNEYLATIPGELHGMEEVSFSTLQGLIDESGVAPLAVPGGSASNMLRGLASLGQRCAVVGKVGRDENGSGYVNALRETGVDAWLCESDTPTSVVLSMVAPDGHRTMRTFFGASEEMRADDLIPDIAQGVRLLHIEGYSLFNPGPMRRAIQLAKAAGARISIDLASFEVVRQFKPQVLQLLTDSIDVVFANEDEVYELTGAEPERGCDLITEMVDTVVVMVGKKGCWVRQDDEKFNHPTYVVDNPLDTTGAGDLFASGFLHGYLSGLSLADCARIGSITGSTVVQVLGAVIPPPLWPNLLDEISTPTSV